MSLLLLFFLFIHLLSLTVTTEPFASHSHLLLEIDGEKRREKPCTNLTRWLLKWFRVVPQRPWAEVMLYSTTLADNTDEQKKKSDTIIPSWMRSSGKRIVSPERVSELLQRAENTLSYFLLLLCYFKLWNLIEKPADSLLNSPLFFPPRSRPSYSPVHPPLFLFCFHFWESRKQLLYSLLPHFRFRPCKTAQTHGAF